MKRLFTDVWLKAQVGVKSKRRQTIWDTHQHGLAVRISAGGVVAFNIIARRAGRKRLTFFKLGSYPALSLKEAREKTPTVLQMLARGESPKEAERERLRAEQRREADTFGVVAEAHFEWLKARKVKSAKQRESTIRRETKGWRDRPIAGITRRDIIEVVEKIAARGTVVAAHNTLSYIKRLFSWAVARDVYGLPFDPAASIKPKDIIGTLRPRDRVLTDDELRAVWQVSLGLGYPWSPFVRLLMLSGARLREIANLKRAEFDESKALLVIPGTRMKSGEPHTVPLSPTALALLKELPRFKGEHLFSTTGGKRAISGFSKFKAALDRAVAQLRAEQRTGRQGALPEVEDFLPRWVFHDLRRTCRTRLSALGVLDTVAELVIGHRQQGLRAVYDQFRYDDQKRQALVKWESALFAVVSPPSEPLPDKVVSLADKRRSG